jgi:hypothetical protein
VSGDRPPAANDKGGPDLPTLRIEVANVDHGTIKTNALVAYGGNSLSMMRAACRSAVAKPSVNRSYTDATGLKSLGTRNS